MIQKITAFAYHKRMQSLYWRIGMMALAYLLDGIVYNLELLDLGPDMVILVGLILGEVSKYLNPKAK